MKIETREIYKCEYCNKLYQRKRFAKVHEDGCKKNPANYRRCFGCAHLHKVDAQYTYETYTGEDTQTVHVLHCRAKDVYLFPPKVEAKENWFDFGDKPNNPMPMECALYEWEYSMDVMLKNKHQQEDERIINEL
jgi:hypothetical protein